MRIRTIVAGTAALVLLAGCDSGGTSGTPTNAPQPTGTGNGAGAPKISNPLDLTAAESDPCAVVTAAQLQTYGLTGVAGKVNTTAPGAGCSWPGVVTDAEMTPGVTILPNGTSLESIYAKKDSTYPVFEPQADVQGYPAAVALAVDQRKDGSCELFVGASEDKAILFSFQSFAKSRYFADPCAGATEFANLAMTTIKAGAK
ncbi:DUF3558 domain-containing protein [Lentzea sp. NPDC058436]|uniref:DUF3558 domain-containing protein n=1 Tax=Lentzea sp. NPDC058436 TaxID=3346499 RepID=UPI0036483C99